MSCRRRRQHSLGGRCERRTPNNVDRLAFKYMEMCKVESSTDSDSGTSPRWSDNSTMGCVSSAPEGGTLRRMAPLRPLVRPGCSSLCLDPYDGSSEDSDESAGNATVTRRVKEHGRVGGGRFSGRSRRFSLNHSTSSALREVVKNTLKDPVTEQPLPQDVQMNCGSDSELWVCELDPASSSKDGCGDLTGRPTDHLTARVQAVMMQPQLDDSGFLANMSSTPVGWNASLLVESSFERSPSPSDLLSVSKRKLGIPGAEEVEVRRKKQCVLNMENEEAGDSTSESFHMMVNL